MGNCFSSCWGREDDHFDNGAGEWEQPVRVTLVQEKKQCGGKRW